MRYKHESSGLDVGINEPFKLANPELNDVIKYPANWLKNATADEIAALGFVAYEPEAPKEIPPTLDELYPPLAKYQFEVMTNYLGVTDAIETALTAMPDGIEKLTAQALYKHGDEMGHYKRSSPLFTSLGPAIGKTDEEINAAWNIGVKL